MVALVRGELEMLQRCTLEALIVLDVHGREVVKTLIENQIEDPSDFAWLAQVY